MGKFDGVLICTDLDGTLLRNDKSISAENKAAIDYFKAEGGRFTFVTGRTPNCVDDIHAAIRPNAPFGCINGAGLYDYEKQKYVWKDPMAEGVSELIRCVDAQFPDVGIQVNTFYKTFFCKENKTMAVFRQVTQLPNLVCRYTDVSEPIAKIIFGCETEEEIMGVRALLSRHPLANRFDFVRAEKTLYEIIPKGVNKGTVLLRLAEVLGIPQNRTVAIGDYNNDAPMIRTAGIGVAVANACAETLAAADHVTVSNEEHAVARLIDDLGQGKLRFN